MALKARLSAARMLVVPVVCGVLAVCATASAEQAGPSGAVSSLAEMPRPWERMMHRITRQEYEETLRFWTEKHPTVLAVESPGKSAEGVPIFLLKITDAAVPDADKQICLITSLHGGPERSGTTTVLHLIEWLLGNAPEAVEVRRKQIVLLMPIVNPHAFFVTDRFFNSQGIDPYTGGGADNWDLRTLTFKAAAKSSEIVAFLSVVDRYHPEVHADVHGVGLQEYPPDRLGERCMYEGQTMFEITGSAYSNYALRPWDWRVMEAMVDAGKAAGYGSDRFEADAQRGFWAPDMQPIADRLWLGRPRFYTAQYAYAKYHTMVTALEVGWEASGVARLQGLLRIGNSVWDGEPVPGYPVDRVESFCGHFVTAWGTTAEDRRRSRVELWNRQGGFSRAMLYPQTDGRDTFVCAVTQRAAKLLDPDKAKFLSNIKALPGLDHAPIEAFVNAGPEARLYIEQAIAAPSAEGTPIRHGIALRLRIPYHNPKLLDLRLNGRSIPESRTDGCHTWFADGYTQVQINIPPDKACRTELFLVTCAYKPDVPRTYGWKPPREVTERLKSAKE